MEIIIDNEKFVLKKAKVEDLEKVLGLLVDAAEWLKTKNTSQWDYYIRDLEGNTPEVLDSIENGATYILEHDEKTVATVTLEENPNEWDAEIWGEDVNKENVVYLHRLVVHRDYKGRDLGTELLKWAEDYVKSKGKSYIRFDCLGSNKGLNNYYQRRYELKEYVNIYGGHCKYEVSVG